MRKGRVTACAVGLKGAVFLKGLQDNIKRFNRIVSYEQKDDESASFDEIKRLSDESGAVFETGRRPLFEAGELAFLVGWQFLVQPPSNVDVVVFHDSLLPHYRGFAPTVTALIRGDCRIGVTALAPTEGTDEGPILAQADAEIRYPMKIAKALELQAGLMSGLAIDIISRWEAGPLARREQDHTCATYSLWRDERDYLIDWTQSAAEIARMVDATGFPYAGAQTFLDGEPITVDDVTEVPDLAIALRSPGKVWAMSAGCPIVVCGEGLLRLDRCRFADERAVTFNKLRVRLG